MIVNHNQCVWWRFSRRVKRFVSQMAEKYDAIWVDFDNDDCAEIVSEFYSASQDKLFVIYKRKDGMYMPFSYVKKTSPQWSLPFWSSENTKLLLSTLVEAQQYLIAYGAGT
jgi:hypothetical protein